jgi:hypothetical protein
MQWWPSFDQMLLFIWLSAPCNDDPHLKGRDTNLLHLEQMVLAISPLVECLASRCGCGREVVFFDVCAKGSPYTQLFAKTRGVDTDHCYIFLALVSFLSNNTWGPRGSCTRYSCPGGASSNNSPAWWRTLQRNQTDSVVTLQFEIREKSDCRIYQEELTCAVC